MDCFTCVFSSFPCKKLVDVTGILSDRRIQKAWCGHEDGILLLSEREVSRGARPPSIALFPEKKWIFHLKWYVLVNSERYFVPAITRKMCWIFLPEVVICFKANCPQMLNLSLCRELQILGDSDSFPILSPWFMPMLIKCSQLVCLLVSTTNPVTL